MKHLTGCSDLAELTMTSMAGICTGLTPVPMSEAKSEMQGATESALSVAVLIIPSHRM
jgi:hypothetical protein